MTNEKLRIALLKKEEIESKMALLKKELKEIDDLINEEAETRIKTIGLPELRCGDFVIIQKEKATTEFDFSKFIADEVNKKIFYAYASNPENKIKITAEANFKKFVEGNNGDYKSFCNTTYKNSYFAKLNVISDKEDDIEI